MKTDNLPIKIECYSINTVGGHRELIGFIIIPLRTIPLSKGTNIEKPSMRWHKLIGLSSQWKPQKPELHMCVVITDTKNSNQFSMMVCIQII